MRAVRPKHMDTVLVHYANLALHRLHKCQRNILKSGDRNTTHTYASTCRSCRLNARTHTHRHTDLQVEEEKRGFKTKI